MLTFLTPPTPFFANVLPTMCHASSTSGLVIYLIGETQLFTQSSSQITGKIRS